MIKLFYKLKYGLLNLIYWFKVIWSDRNYDYDYLYKILRHKLVTMSKSIEKTKYFIGYENEVQKINLLIKLIDKILSEEYRYEYTDYIKKDYKFIKSPKGERYTMEDTVIYDNLNEFFEKYKKTYNLYKNKESREIIAILIANHNHKKAKKLIFTIMNDNIEKWWY